MATDKTHTGIFVFQKLEMCLWGNWTQGRVQFLQYKIIFCDWTRGLNGFLWVLPFFQVCILVWAVHTPELFILIIIYRWKWDKYVCHQMWLLDVFETLSNTLHYIVIYAYLSLPLGFRLLEVMFYLFLYLCCLAKGGT